MCIGRFVFCAGEQFEKHIKLIAKTTLEETWQDILKFLNDFLHDTRYATILTEEINFINEIISRRNQNFVIEKSEAINHMIQNPLQATDLGQSQVQHFSDQFFEFTATKGNIIKEFVEKVYINIV